MIEVVNKPGKQNTNADALSRFNVLQRENTEPLETDADMKTKILQESHDSVLGGHRGMNKTYAAIQEHYSWPKMREDVENYVKRCAKCQLNKALRPRVKAPMEITTAKSPFERCALDIVGPITETTSGNIS